jgi:hypothetical protein
MVRTGLDRLGREAASLLHPWLRGSCLLDSDESDQLTSVWWYSLSMWMSVLYCGDVATPSYRYPTYLLVRSDD